MSTGSFVLALGLLEASGQIEKAEELAPQGTSESPVESTASVTTCDAAHLDAAAFNQALTLELSLLGLHLYPETSPGSLLEEVDWQARTVSERTIGHLGAHWMCENAQQAVRLLVFLESPEGGQRSERFVATEDIAPEAVHRTLAIALSELLRTSLVSQQQALLKKQAEEVARQRRELEVRSQEKAVQAEVPDPRRTRLGDLQMALSGILSETIATNGVLLGGEVGLSFQHFQAWRWAVESSWSRGSFESPLGDLAVDKWGLSVGGDFHFRGLESLQVGPRVQMHCFSAQGESLLGFDEARQRGYGLSLDVRGSFELSLGRHWLVRMSVDTGPILRSMTFTAAGHPIYDFQGLYLQGGLGAVFRL